MERKEIQKIQDASKGRGVGEGLFKKFVEIILIRNMGEIVMVLQRISLITIGAFNLPILRSFYKSLGW